jgi:hypothetical protein
MSWDDYNRRRAAIKSALAYAASNPSAGLPYDYLPEVKAIFATRREFMLALQYDWSQALWARIELLSLEANKGGLSDAGQLAQRAWDACAAANPVLRRVLDDVRAELGPAARRENELMTWAA